MIVMLITAQPAGEAPLPCVSPWNLTSALLPLNDSESPYAVRRKYFISWIVVSIDEIASSGTPNA